MSRSNVKESALGVLPTKLKKELGNLKDDASKVIADLSSLSERIATVGKDKSQDAIAKGQDVLNEVSKVIEKDLDALRKRIGELEGEYIDTIKKKFGEFEEEYNKQKKVVAEHIKKNPYAYVLGAVGVGFLVGKLLSLKEK
jgi:ElaB/YqjD/DUF883 family membrane-anchored ribosome-binding protein